MRRRNDQSIGEVIRAFFEDNPGIRQKILEVRVERAWGRDLRPHDLTLYPQSVHERDGAPCVAHICCSPQRAFDE